MKGQIMNGRTALLLIIPLLILQLGSIPSNKGDGYNALKSHLTYVKMCRDGIKIITGKVIKVKKSEPQLVLILSDNYNLIKIDNIPNPLVLLHWAIGTRVRCVENTNFLCVPYIKLNLSL